MAGSKEFGKLHLLRVGLWPVQGCFRAYIGLAPEIKGRGG